MKLKDGFFKRVKHLGTAIQLSPTFMSPMFQLGYGFGEDIIEGAPKAEMEVTFTGFLSIEADPTIITTLFEQGLGQYHSVGYTNVMITESSFEQGFNELWEPLDLQNRAELADFISSALKRQFGFDDVVMVYMKDQFQIKTEPTGNAMLMHCSILTPCDKTNFDYWGQIVTMQASCAQKLGEFLEELGGKQSAKPQEPPKTLH